MKRLSNDMAVQFCEYCNMAYVHWVTFCALFPSNFGLHHVKTPAAAPALGVVNYAVQEHSLHEICKLHDPAIQRGQANLCIDYVVQFGKWTPQVRSELKQIKAKLDTFANKLRPARNKILSHNDLARIQAKTALGGYASGEAEKYFENLQAFVNVVHRNTKGGDLPFYKGAKDSAEALHTLLRI